MLKGRVTCHRNFSDSPNTNLQSDTTSDLSTASVFAALSYDP